MCDIPGSKPMYDRSHAFEKGEGYQSSTDLGNSFERFWCCTSFGVEPDPFPVTEEAFEKVLTPGETVVAVGAGAVVTAGSGYLIYRGIRLLPSLFPALWWTLPANLTTPQPENLLFSAPCSRERVHAQPGEAALVMLKKENGHGT